MRPPEDWWTTHRSDRSVVRLTLRVMDRSEQSAAVSLTGGAVAFAFKQGGTGDAADAADNQGAN